MDRPEKNDAARFDRVPTFVRIAGKAGAMFERSLTTKILLAVGVTVAVVIAIYTYFVIRVQNTWWYERTQVQNVLVTTMINEHLLRVMPDGRGEEMRDFLLQLKKSQEIAQGRIIGTDGKIIFSTDSKEIKRSYYKTPPELYSENRILHGTRTQDGEKLAVAITPVENHPECYKCHDPKQRFRGAIVLEKSMAPADVSIAANRNLLIAYGVVIFALVGVVLWLLIVRFVTQPVRGVLGQMQRVQQGDLDAWAAVESGDEIGKLAQGFNAMVKSLETARRELHESHEKQIQQADKLASIGELASGIAHEIRNPLAGISAAVEVLAENSNGNRKFAEVADEIHQQITRLNRTLRDLLNFARPRELEIAPCDVRELIKPMLALVRSDAQKQRVQIIEDFAPDLPPISADAPQLQQAILNILLNAIQAMPNGGTMTVRTEQNGSGLAPVPAPGPDWHDADPAIQRAEEAVSIIVHDTGTGIARENLSKIFSPFYTTKHRGTGLGLSITQTIVGKHHGTIAVESEPGCGTTVRLRFMTALASMGQKSPALSRQNDTGSGGLDFLGPEKRS